MKKYIFCIALSVLLFGSGDSGGQQQKPNVPRIGFLSASYVSSTRENIDALRQGLRERGYVEGKTIEVVYRYAEGKVERLPELVAELVQLKVDIIVVQTAPRLWLPNVQPR
jgi:putative ABC transport system substrate-binding protein